MKIKIEKIFIVLILLIMILSNFSFVFSASEEPNLLSEAAILIDSKTGKILYDKNSNKKMYPASTTKIVTAILALEHCNLNDIVTASYNAIASVPEGYSNADLQVGEQLTVEQLLQVLLLYSANDAANVLAEHVGGSIDSFVSMMNTKVNELGLFDTHFTNAYGKHDDNHYTTAHDLALIMQYCVKNQNFRRLAGNASCAIPATNLHEPRKYTSTNELIDPSNINYYKYITAGKTGFTTQAGDCLVSSSYKNDLELICVILGGKTENGISTRFSETKTLYEYGYKNYSMKSIINANDIIYQLKVQNATSETENLNLLADSSINVLLKNDIEDDSLTPKITLKENISAPIDEGSILGTAKYQIDGVEYTVNLVASHDVVKSKFINIFIDIFIVFLLTLATFFIFFHKNKDSSNSDSDTISGTDN